MDKETPLFLSEGQGIGGEGLSDRKEETEKHMQSSCGQNRRDCYIVKTGENKNIQPIQQADVIDLEKNRVFINWKSNNYRPRTHNIDSRYKNIPESNPNQNKRSFLKRTNATYKIKYPSEFYMESLALSETPESPEKVPKESVDFQSKNVQMGIKDLLFMAHKNKMSIKEGKSELENSEPDKPSVDKPPMDKPSVDRPEKEPPCPEKPSEQFHPSLNPPCSIPPFDSVVKVEEECFIFYSGSSMRKNLLGGRVLQIVQLGGQGRQRGQRRQGAEGAQRGEGGEGGREKKTREGQEGEEREEREREEPGDTEIGEGGEQGRKFVEIVFCYVDGKNQCGIYAVAIVEQQFLCYETKKLIVDSFFQIEGTEKIETILLKFGSNDYMKILRQLKKERNMKYICKWKFPFCFEAHNLLKENSKRKEKELHRLQDFYFKKNNFIGEFTRKSFLHFFEDSYIFENLLKKKSNLLSIKELDELENRKFSLEKLYVPFAMELEIEIMKMLFTVKKSSFHKLFYQFIENYCHTNELFRLFMKKIMKNKRKLCLSCWPEKNFIGLNLFVDLESCLKNYLGVNLEGKYSTMEKFEAILSRANSNRASFEITSRYWLENREKILDLISVSKHQPPKPNPEASQPSLLEFYMFEKYPKLEKCSLSLLPPAPMVKKIERKGKGFKNFLIELPEEDMPQFQEVEKYAPQSSSKKQMIKSYQNSLTRTKTLQKGKNLLNFFENSLEIPSFPEKTHQPIELPLPSIAFINQSCLYLGVGARQLLFEPETLSLINYSYCDLSDRICMGSWGVLKNTSKGGKGDKKDKGIQRGEKGQKGNQSKNDEDATKVKIGKILMIFNCFELECVMSDDQGPWKCTCDFSKFFELPCRHILCGMMKFEKNVGKYFGPYWN